MRINYVLAAVLSVIPGLGHFVLKRYKKALSLFCIDAGIAAGIIFPQAYVMKFIAAGIYFVTFLPNAAEAYQIARYGHNTISTDARWYVVLLLLTTGFAALPLLWSSKSFSKRAKAAWTVAVPVLAIAFFSSIAVYWDEINGVLAGIIKSFLRQ